MESESEINLETIRNACMDSEGYVIFAAVMTKDKDDENNPTITFHYRRYHFALEDTQQAIRHFKKQLDGEVENYFGDEETQPA